ncbi:TonB-dependent receptor [Flagellimonas sp.]|uniref:TonB-dependent receptor n=1 Tax=Flagellimonas sp. TaxID=2058762 RepID=UPI003BB0DB8A
MLNLQANNTYSQKTRISLDFEDVTTENVLEAIERSTDFRFVYKLEDVNLQRLITINVKDQRIKAVLDILFDGTLTDYKVRNTQVMLRKRVQNNTGPVGANESMQFTVSGAVTDGDGNPLPGASIVEKGTANGTDTDFDGNFSIDVSDENAVLEVSYIGFVTQSIPLSGRTSLGIVLVEDTAQLEEVVVVGYGVQERKTVAGAVDQIDSEILENRPVNNVTTALQGAIPGLTITKSSGQPGRENFNINIRGFSSINNGNNPLVVIDGIPGSLDLLNPNDIANVTVLKDAAAAIYGARAAGGVLLITTKRGKKGEKPKIELSSTYSINTPANLFELVDVRQWAEMEIDAIANAGGTSGWVDWIDNIGPDTPPLPLDPAGNAIFFQTTNLNDLVFENGHQQQYNANVSGGGEHSDYLFSAGYVFTDGIIAPAPDDNERLNLRMNYGFDISDKLRLDTRISLEDNKRRETADVHTGARLSGTDRALESVVSNYVWFPALTEGGNYFGQWGWGSPLGSFDNGVKTQNTQVIRTNVKATFKPVKGLTITGQAGLTSTNRNTENITKQVPYYNFRDEFQYFEYGTDIPFVYKQNEKTTYRNYTAYFDYETLIADKHNVAVTGGASHEEQEYQWFLGQRQGFSQEELFALNLGGSDNVISEGGGEHWAIKSFFGRARYSFDSKYIAEFNFRRDGTSRFSPDQRWGNFYGVFGAWVLSEEKFMADQNIFDNLKLRVSWGTTGNQDAGGLYDYLPNINLGTFNYAFGDSPAPTLSASEAGLVSTIRSWEELKTTNFGFDVAFLDSRLNVGFDYFVKKNDNMLVGVNLPAVLGGSPPSQNIGELETKGWELNLGWNDQTESGFSYGVRFNVADNKNKLIDLNGADLASSGLNGTREGFPINTYFGYRFTGLIQTQEQLDTFASLENLPSSQLGLGDSMFEDINGDGRISVVDDEGNDADIVPLGTVDPRYTFGVNLNAAFKGWDFSAFIQGVAKRTHFYSGDFAIPWSQPWRPPIKRFYGTTWTPENTDAPYPRLITNDVRWHNWRHSTLFKQNGAYARLKNVTLGYTLPVDVTNKVGIDKIRLFFSGEDLLTIDHLDGGYDAENSGATNIYPFTKRYAFGVNITL